MMFPDFLQQLNLVVVAPSPTASNFSGWWKSAIRRVPMEMRNGLNSLIILVSWEVWKHRNSCVFEGTSPNIQVLLQSVGDECSLWCMAGASNLQELLIRLPSPDLYRLWLVGCYPLAMFSVYPHPCTSFSLLMKWHGALLHRLRKKRLMLLDSTWQLTVPQAMVLGVWYKRSTDCSCPKRVSIYLGVGWWLNPATGSNGPALLESYIFWNIRQ